MKLTISDAARLYGIHRSTIHRHMKAGRLSCVFQEDGSRALDLSELIRCYGEPPNSPEIVRQGATPSATPSATHGATPNATGATGQQNNDARTADLLAELLEVTRQQSHTLEQQREELAALRREVAELRTLPAPGALAPHDQLAPDQTPPPKRHTTERPAMACVSESALSFGDLLERMEKRQQH